MIVTWLHNFRNLLRSKLELLILIKDHQEMILILLHIIRVGVTTQISHGEMVEGPLMHTKVVLIHMEGIKALILHLLVLTVMETHNLVDKIIMGSKHLVTILKARGHLLVLHMLMEEPHMILKGLVKVLIHLVVPILHKMLLPDFKIGKHHNRTQRSLIWMMYWPP
ncbi:hypothetical protein RchiOBHm_Chr3g0452831 [Rosa chinensis]|uniref:Uncharacterized protein n=1 Tax=Rosa chinensis TaxID=74649 RepID=A0A2P6R6D7_ROSCH|nr:hypothetical protein RchiOBHm_Chr3g0452831 [Rosa chinensis]